jgi:hypothetical protein
MTRRKPLPPAPPSPPPADEYAGLVDYPARIRAAAPRMLVILCRMAAASSSATLWDLAEEGRKIVDEIEGTV